MAASSPRGSPPRRSRPGGSGESGSLWGREALAIVVVGSSDPVAEGWAESLARPGGNVTGLTVTMPGLNPKRRQLLAQSISGLSRLALLRGPLREPMPLEHAAARLLGIHLLTLPTVEGPDDVALAINEAVRQRPRPSTLSRARRCSPTGLASPGSLSADGYLRSGSSGCPRRQACS